MSSFSAALGPGTEGRCQLALTTPFALLGGGLFGLQVAERTGLPAPAGVVVGALALLAFLAFQVAMSAPLADALGGPDGRWGPWVSYLWDAATGTVLGLPVVAVFGAPALPAVGAAVTFGAAYGYLAGSVLCGAGTESLVRLVLQGGAMRGAPPYAHARTLASQGRVREALEIYRRAMASDPRNPEPWFGVADLQYRFLSDPEGAVLTLRSALAQASLTEGHAIVALQRIAVIRASQGRPEAVAPDLARYLERRPEGKAADWARETLSGIKRQLPRTRAP